MLRFLFAIVLLAGVSPALAGEIRGKVTDAQGSALAGAAVIVEREGQSGRDPWRVQTAADGAFVVETLEPGRYIVRVQRAGFAEQRQGPLELQNGTPLLVNFRLAPSAEAEAVRGAEERNPNDFIIRLDTNAIANELARTGSNLRFVTEFRADRNAYAEPFGYPLKAVEWAAPGRLLSAFHGSLYEFHQNGALNARPFFQVGSLLPSRRNQYGFSVSGPVVRDRLSFVFAWGQIRDSGFVNGNVQVPLADERAPRSGDPEKNAIIAALLSAYPAELPNLPHVSRRHLNTNALRDIRSTAFSVHLDGTRRNGDRLAFDQNFSDTKEDPFELVIGQNPQTITRPQTARFTYTRAFSPRTTGQLSLSYERLGALLVQTERYRDLLAGQGISSVPDIDLGDELSNVGLPGQGIPRKRYENHYLLSPQATHSTGRHNFAVGGFIKHLWDSDQRSSNGRGTYLFNRDTIVDCVSGVERQVSAVEMFLCGQPSRLSLTVGNQYRGYRNWEFAAYVHDRFQVRPGLTFNWGLRYEALTKPKDVSGSFEFVHDTDANNFAPQFGFAWNSGRAGIVVRGGYGVSFGTLTLATWNRQAGNPPQNLSLSVDKPNLLEIRGISALVPDATRRSGLGMFDPEAAVPYSHIYNLALERELPGAMLLRAGYQGVRTYKMFTGFTLNRARAVPGIVATSANVNARRPDPRYLRIYDIVNGSNSYHDGLQVSLAKRRTRGLSFDVRYSFSKTLDTAVSNFADTGNGGDNAQTEEVFSDVKSVSAFDTPHSLAITYSYEISRLSGGPGWVSALLARWTVSGTTIFRSGTTFGVFTGSDGPGSGNLDGEGGDRPNLLDPAILGRSFDDPDTSTALMGVADCRDVPSGAISYRQCRYFDTNLAVGGRGSIGYRVFRKDGTDNWNFALARSFALPGAGTERQLQFRGEFYNFFNHAQFAAPGNNIASPTFGQITNTVNKGRVTQLTLRLVF